MTGAPTESSEPALANAVVRGDYRAAARLITRIEARDPSIESILRALYVRGRDTPVIGVTGPPGAGKSTITDQLVACSRAQAERVAVLAVDPSSPLTGGAVLGDRVRMTRHNTDAGVFIRSMSARGRLGGLAGATGDALIVLDAMGFDRIFVETVGAGQNEVDILYHAHTITLVQTPAGGDAIQMMKSGLLEIADVFVVNKSDTPGADRMLALLRDALEQNGAHGPDEWCAPVLKTQAAEGIGTAELDASLRTHARHLDEHPSQKNARRRARARALLVERMAEMLRARHGNEGRQHDQFERQVDDILMRRCDPGTAARTLLGGTL